VGLAEADYDLEIPRVVEEIRKRGSKVVGFQMPDGLKRYIPLLRAAVRSETEAVPIFSTDPCFGACDLSRSLADLGCDLIVHMGHSRMVGERGIPVIYVPCYSLAAEERIIKRIAEAIPVQRVGLIASLQEVRALPRLSAELSKRGFEVHMGGPSRGTQHRGQVLGCNLAAVREVENKVDAFIYVGGGDFHPMGAALATGKKVYVVDPYLGELRDVEKLKRRVLHKRFGAIERARGARSFGLLLSTKPGQIRMDQALRYREILISSGFDVTLLSSDLLDPTRLVIYDVDAFVNFGCPRLALEDDALFPKPVLTPPEVDILLGTRAWEDYVPDEIT